MLIQVLPDKKKPWPYDDSQGFVFLMTSITE